MWDLKKLEILSWNVLYPLCLTIMAQINKLLEPEYQLVFNVPTQVPRNTSATRGVEKYYTCPLVLYLTRVPNLKDTLVVKLRSDVNLGKRSSKKRWFFFKCKLRKYLYIILEITSILWSM